MYLKTKKICLKCTHCSQITAYQKASIVCPQCGGTILQAEYDLEELVHSHWKDKLPTRYPSLWRYHELLPLFDLNHIVTLGEGWTPLIHAQRFGKLIGLDHLYIKDERQNPTGSFKDRQASVTISVMQEQGIKDMVLASTGNVAISYSAYAARAGIKLWAFLSGLTPDEKIREIRLYGAETVKVPGTYDQTKQVAAKFAQDQGIFLDSGLKSFTSGESMKTMALELGEQLHGKAPDWFIQGVSGAMGPIGVVKGFEEMMAVGMVDKVPRLGMIQSSGCNPMVQAFEKGEREAIPVTDPQTAIATLATGNPGFAYSWLYDLMQKYGGAMEQATDAEAYTATRLLAQTEGISVEPATAVAFAGLIKLAQRGIIQSQECVVINCSGHTYPVEEQILTEEFAPQASTGLKL